MADENDWFTQALLRKYSSEPVTLARVLSRTPNPDLQSAGPLTPTNKMLLDVYGGESPDPINKHGSQAFGMFGSVKIPTEADIATMARRALAGFDQRARQSPVFDMSHFQGGTWMEAELPRWLRERMSPYWPSSWGGRGSRYPEAQRLMVETEEARSPAERADAQDRLQYVLDELRAEHLAEQSPRTTEPVAPNTLAETADRAAQTSTMRERQRQLLADYYPDIKMKSLAGPAGGLTLADILSRYSQNDESR